MSTTLNGCTCVWVVFLIYTFAKPAAYLCAMCRRFLQVHQPCPRRHKAQTITPGWGGGGERGDPSSPLPPPPFPRSFNFTNPSTFNSIQVSFHLTLHSILHLWKPIVSEPWSKPEDLISDLLCPLEKEREKSGPSLSCSGSFVECLSRHILTERLKVSLMSTLVSLWLFSQELCPSSLYFPSHC